jgi:hypothetical protein
MTSAFKSLLSRRLGRPVAWGLLAFGLLLVAGCGSDTPFKIVPVHGTVKFKDGSLIQADQVVVTFYPQEVAGAGKNTATAAMGDVNVADGTVAGLTTHRNLDGAVVGKHKVTVQALKKGPGGVGMPIGAVPSRYARVETTPLTVDVTGSGSTFTLEIEKTP